MKYIVTAAEMKQMDEMTSSHFGLPVMVLMERAALAVAEAVKRKLPLSKEADARTPRVSVFAGSGNNGADAVAAGRLLLLEGYRVRFILLSDKDNASELLIKQVGIAERYGAVMERFAELQTEKEALFKEAMYETDAVIDGLFGIGLKRNVEGQYADAVKYINACPRAHVVSVDMPSGIDTDTGEVLGCAVQADETVTFDFVKAGAVFYPGSSFAGKVTCASAGINVTGTDGDRLTPKAFSFDETDLPLTKRYSGGNKGSFGKILVAAGSGTVSGAAVLSARAALRTGAGMVKVFTAAENKDVMKSLIPEALLSVYGVIKENAEEAQKEQAQSSIREKLLRDMKWSDAMLLGPGIGTGRTASFLVKTVLEEYDKPLVLDADALNLIAMDDELKRLTAAYGNGINKWIIITPHLQEFSRLAKVPVKECAKQLLTLPKRLAQELHVTVLCKDARSVIADDLEERLCVNTSGNAGMATAGSGDVLAGMCAALIAEKESAFYTASIAAFLHGVAGDKAAKARGERNMIAGDIIEELKGLLT
ncbi:MAG: NAD(P)H-hydrate dehydratase [Lachnospiraceae bacterium]|nr:NAD(P)H-hydrate dehydratase [Lachnospiraceae bacterium]